MSLTAAVGIIHRDCSCRPVPRTSRPSTSALSRSSLIDRKVMFTPWAFAFRAARDHGTAPPPTLAGMRVRGAAAGGMSAGVYGWLCHLVTGASGVIPLVRLPALRGDVLKPRLELPLAAARRLPGRCAASVSDDAREMRNRLSYISHQFTSVTCPSRSSRLRYPWAVSPRPLAPTAGWPAAAAPGWCNAHAPHQRSLNRWPGSPFTPGRPYSGSVPLQSSHVLIVQVRFGSYRESQRRQYQGIPSTPCGGGRPEVYVRGLPAVPLAAAIFNPGESVNARSPAMEKPRCS